MQYNGGMKFRTGLLIGAAVGYYYGTKAGPERYAQIERVLDKVRATGPYESMKGKVAELRDQGRERALGLVDGINERSKAQPDVTIGTQRVSPRDDTEPFDLMADARFN